MTRSLIFGLAVTFEQCGGGGPHDIYSGVPEITVGEPLGLALMLLCGVLAIWLAKRG